MIIFLFAAVISFWIGCFLILWILKKDLFISTWKEPYFDSIPVLIESDDWGPGAEFHADRLQRLLNLLGGHRDVVNRCAVLTANIVLSLPDMQKIDADPHKNYHRVILNNFSPEIYNTMLIGIKAGSFIPQLHGLEHWYGKAFAELWHQKDLRLSHVTLSSWWDWEQLDSPLQGHYVNGTTLPTQPVHPEENKIIIETATKIFSGLFGYPSYTTVAPCYLWNDDIELMWQENGIKSIQTAGYRCIGRDIASQYLQNPKIIRFGTVNSIGQTYLVRNVMFEPSDGKHTYHDSIREMIKAKNQALPICISTHRYNYTRTEQECLSALTGLDHILNAVANKTKNFRFISSPELASSLDTPAQKITNYFNGDSWSNLSFLRGIGKISAYIARLFYRHPKLVIISYITGLAIPAWLVFNLCKIKIKT